MHEHWRVWADQAARKPWDEFTEVVMPPLVAERDALQARVEVLTAALTRLVDDGDPDAWDNARAALAAGVASE